MKLILVFLTISMTSWVALAQGILADAPDYYSRLKKSTLDAGINGTVACTNLKGDAHEKTYDYLRDSYQSYVDKKPTPALPELLKNSNNRAVNQTVKDCIIEYKKRWFDGEYNPCGKHNRPSDPIACAGLQAGILQAFSNWHVPSDVAAFDTPLMPAPVANPPPRLYPIRQAPAESGQEQAPAVSEHAAAIWN